MSVRRLVVVGLLVGAAASLSGCVGLEAVHAVAQAGNTAVSDLAPAQRMTIVSNELESATPATYKPFAYRSGQECISSAFVVPYDRTWPEEIRDSDNGEVRVLPPEPGKIAGYIAVVYKKDCPGATSQPLLRAGRQATVTGTGTIFTRAFSSDKTTYFMSANEHSVDTRDMITDTAAKPKWWPQIVERLARLSKSDPAIKMMLAANVDNFAKAAPEQADQVRAATR